MHFHQATLPFRCKSPNLFFWALQSHFLTPKLQSLRDLFLGQTKEGGGRDSQSKIGCSTSNVFIKHLIKEKTSDVVQGLGWSQSHPNRTILTIKLYLLSCKTHIAEKYRQHHRKCCLVDRLSVAFRYLVFPAILSRGNFTPCNTKLHKVLKVQDIFILENPFPKSTRITYINKYFTCSLM